MYAEGARPEKLTISAGMVLLHLNALSLMDTEGSVTTAQGVTSGFGGKDSGVRKHIFVFNVLRWHSGAGMAQWVERPTEKPDAVLTRVRVLGALRDFSPRVNRKRVSFSMCCDEIAGPE